MNKDEMSKQIRVLSDKLIAVINENDKEKNNSPADTLAISLQASMATTFVIMMNAHKYSTMAEFKQSYDHVLETVIDRFLNLPN